MQKSVITLHLTLLACAAACAQTVEGKKIVGGHGHALASPRLVRLYGEEMKRAPLDGLMLTVNRNAIASRGPLADIAAPLWFRPPAVTIDEFSIVLDDLARADLGPFRHNIIWCHGLRSIGADLWDDEGWDKIVLNNARVMAEVCKRAPFEAVWFDIETDFVLDPARRAALAGGGHTVEECAAKTRQRGRQLMEAFVSVKPDFKLIVSHGYGLVLTVAGGDPDMMADSPYALIPAFYDGLLEGCGERGLLISGHEETYPTTTYAGFMAARRWDTYAAGQLSHVSAKLLRKSYRHAMAMWPDAESAAMGWHDDDLEKNHFSPERMKHALHNAMAASDEYVWTWSMHAHWWPNRSPCPSGYTELPSQMPDGEYVPAPPERSRVLNDAYMTAVRDSREPMRLDWHPDRTAEKGYPKPVFDAEKALSSIEGKYQRVMDFSKGWRFHPADSSNPHVWGWGVPMYLYGKGIDRAYDWTRITIGDYWENQGTALDGVGVYRRSFRVPERARGQRLYVAIAGVAGNATIYVARRGAAPGSVGRTTGAEVALFDVTDAVDVKGDNYLTIAVASPQGPGGIYGAVRLLGAEKGREGFISLPGKELNLSDISKLMPLYDWPAAKGARMVPRDVPRLDATNELHAQVEPGTFETPGESFSARITFLSVREAAWDWPAVTLNDLDVKDWRPYAAVAVRLHNPTDRTQAVGFSIRDADNTRWSNRVTIGPKESRTLSVSIDELRATVLASDIRTLTLWTTETDEAQVFLAGPVYLVGKAGS